MRQFLPGPGERSGAVAGDTGNGAKARLPVPESAYFTCLRGDGPRLRDERPAPGSEDFRRVLELEVGRPLFNGSEIRELVNGRRFFPVMLDLIRRARRSITLEIYIWRSGHISNRFIEALSERSRAGVKIHVIGDGVGLVKMKRSDIERLKEAGVHFVFFERPRARKIKANINHRTHRKILVVDGEVGITGGIAIADEWDGDAEDSSRWRDNAYLVRGPAVNQMQAVFAENWLDTTAQLLWGDDYFPQLQEVGRTVAQFYRTQPTGRYSSVRRTLFFAIACARKRICIANAYFIPDAEATSLLVDARKRGVRVEIIVPEISDTALGLGVMRSRLKPLLQSEVVVYRFAGAMFHCKYMIVDDVFVCAGSSNFDPRSFHMHDEADFNAIDPEFAARQVRLFEEDRKRSKPYSLEDHENRPFRIKLFDWFAGLFWRAF